MTCQGWCEHPQRGVPAYAAIEGGSPMDSNKRNTIKGRPRARAINGQCHKDWCDAEISATIKIRDGQSVEETRCTRGHLKRRKRLDADGSTIRAFKAFSISGP